MSYHVSLSFTICFIIIIMLRLPPLRRPSPSRSSIKLCAAIAAIQKLRRIKWKLPGDLPGPYRPYSPSCQHNFLPLLFLPLTILRFRVLFVFIIISGLNALRLPPHFKC